MGKRIGWRNAFLAVAVAATALAGFSGSGSTAAFFAWRVADVSRGDTLNVRAAPTTRSRILVAYPNRTRLSMTGECTGGLHMDQISGWPEWRQRAAVRHLWCAAWVDPGNGVFRKGWVYGRYIRPDTVADNSPQVCGGIAALQCGADEWCNFPPHAQCGAADQTGVCEERPQICTKIYMPVCGCDGRTYGNSCEAASVGVSTLHPGPC
jgi:hypothetical protein